MNRSLCVALLPALLDQQANRSTTCAVVIDVLRATSVMTTAAAAGAASMHTCATTSQAFQIADQHSPRGLLCGERDCQRIDGFNLGNSPAEYTAERVQGRHLVITTTNGTRAIESVMSSRRLLVASFLNLSATAAAIAPETSIELVCAGTNGQITSEDILMAGALVEELTAEKTDWELDDSARLALAAWQRATNGSDDRVAALQLSLEQSLGGRNLMRLGFGEDVKRCAQIDTVGGVIERTHGGEALFGGVDCRDTNIATKI